MPSNTSSSMFFYRKFPKFSQWKQIFKVLTKKEKIILLIFFVLAATSFVFLISVFYFKNTKIAPAFGGTYTEGVIGQPRFINPVYGETNDVDRDLIELIFSGLMSYDKQGRIVSDLVKDYKISEDGKTYEFYLKENIFWHDGKPLTSDDVIFTIKTIQNSDYKSPLRANWLGVETERISDSAFRFKLKSPYNAFLENCTIKIMPRHIWENIPVENFIFSLYNLQPIGSGPFKFKELKQNETGTIKTLTIEANKNYYMETPHISEITFQFFDKKEDLMTAAKKKEIDGFSLPSLNNGDVKNNEKPGNFVLYSFSLPRYFAVFFNTAKSNPSPSAKGEGSNIFSDKNVRIALNYATNKREIIERIGAASEQEIVRPIDSPILPEFFGYENPSQIYEFNIDETKELLEKAGFKEKEGGPREKIIERKPAFQFKSTLSLGSKGNEVEELQKCLAKEPEIYPEGEVTGYFGKSTKEAVARFQKKYSLDITNFGAVGKTTRQKLNELCTPPAQETLPLQFILTTVEQPQLIEAANILKDQWQKVGVSVEIKALDISGLKTVIKERSFDALLFGEILGALPDPYSFWHSSQKNDPGLNLSGYENKDVDKLLKEARETLDENQKKEKLEKFQDLLLKDAPCLFLYNPDYLYWLSEKIKGVEIQKIINPANRFSGVETWYVKTKRVWK